MIVQTQQARIGPATPYPNDVLTASNDDTTFQKERTMVIASQARLRVALVLRVLLAASALLFGGWAGPGALAQEGSLAADIGDDGILTNCVDPAFPPMEYYKDQNADQPIGFAQCRRKGRNFVRGLHLVGIRNLVEARSKDGAQLRKAGRRSRPLQRRDRFAWG